MPASRPFSPGVYIDETGSFPPSIVGVPTAIPAFIGYTEKGHAAPGPDGAAGLPIPVEIASMTEFEAAFGGPFPDKFSLCKGPPPTGDRPIGTLELGTAAYQVARTPAARFNLYRSLQMFFANGGSSCWIVSCGPYAANGSPTPVAKSDLLRGLAAIGDVAWPTMLVIPDATLLADAASFGDLCVQMLDQCLAQRDRVAILDVWVNPRIEREPAGDFERTIATFRNALASSAEPSRRYGMAYYPNIVASLVDPNDITVADFAAANRDGLVAALNEYAGAIHAEAPAGRAAVAALLDDVRSGNWAGSPTAKNDPEPMTAARLTSALVAAIPPLASLRAMIADSRNLIPASGAMAGIFAANDACRGVWNAPANVAVAGAAALVSPISDAQQADLNVPIDGLAVNAIRTFFDRGILVWGARTLDGNSNDWRYIPVSRTTIHIEQSIRLALSEMVFAPNTTQTWLTVRAMIENFLNGLWRAGALTGSSPNEAFSVACGLGSTMTPEDLANGLIRVGVTLSMLRPAEFIRLDFVQQLADR